jgi:hypothetical protein
VTRSFRRSVSTYEEPPDIARRINVQVRRRGEDPNSIAELDLVEGSIAQVVEYMIQPEEGLTVAVERVAISGSNRPKYSDGSVRVLHGSIVPP